VHISVWFWTGIISNNNHCLNGTNTLLVVKNCKKTTINSTRNGVRCRNTHLTILTENLVMCHASITFIPLLLVV
jgi:hypothetical protein